MACGGSCAALEDLDALGVDTAAGPGWVIPLPIGIVFLGRSVTSELPARERSPGEFATPAPPERVTRVPLGAMTATPSREDSV
jgi:hypothetical protein